MMEPYKDSTITWMLVARDGVGWNRVVLWLDAGRLRLQFVGKLPDDHARDVFMYQLPQLGLDGLE